MSDLLVDMDLTSEIISEFIPHNTIEENAKNFAQVIRDMEVIAIEEKDKAHIYEAAFHFANESFYELEDDGEIDDRFETQNDFLEALEIALRQF